MLPRLRAGITYGSAVSRAGDWFGSPINLASRVTSTAAQLRPRVRGRREQIGDDERFRWSFAGEKELRGIDHEVNLFRARRADGRRIGLIGFIRKPEQTEGETMNLDPKNALDGQRKSPPTPSRRPRHRGERRRHPAWRRRRRRQRHRREPIDIATHAVDTAKQAPPVTARATTVTAALRRTAGLHLSRTGIFKKD